MRMHLPLSDHFFVEQGSNGQWGVSAPNGTIEAAYESQAQAEAEAASLNAEVKKPVLNASEQTDLRRRRPREAS